MFCTFQMRGVSQAYVGHLTLKKNFWSKSQPWGWGWGVGHRGWRWEVGHRGWRVGVGGEKCLGEGLN